MTKVTVDPATLGRLRGPKEPLELCDESGRVLGTFTPAAGPPPGGAAAGSGRDREAAAGPGPDFGPETPNGQNQRPTQCGNIRIT